MVSVPHANKHLIKFPTGIATQHLGTGLVILIVQSMEHGIQSTDGVFIWCIVHRKIGFKIPGLRGSGQHVTLPQALRHDLMMAVLLRTIHVNTINMGIQIQNRMSYMMLGVRVQTNPTLLASTGCGFK